MGINGHSITFEQKVLRRIEAKFMFNADGIDESKIKKYMDKMKPSDLLAIYSEVLSEVFP